MAEMNFPYSSCSDLNLYKSQRGLVLWRSAKVICAGGASDEVDDFLKKLHDQIHISGAMGNATEKNIQKKTLDEAIRMCNAIYAVTIEDAIV